MHPTLSGGLLLVLCVVVVRGSVGDLITKPVDQIIRDSNCLKKENVTMEEAIAYLEEQDSQAQLKCFVYCLFEFVEVMDNCKITDDDFDVGDHDIIVANFHETIVNCKSAVTSSDPCVCGHQLAKCMANLEI